MFLTNIGGDLTPCLYKNLRPHFYIKYIMESYDYGRFTTRAEWQNTPKMTEYTERNVQRRAHREPATYQVYETKIFW